MSEVFLQAGDQALLTSVLLKQLMVKKKKSIFLTISTGVNLITPGCLLEEILQQGQQRLG